MSRDGVKAKDKFIWEPQILCPPPIYVQITTVRNQGAYVSADCWQGSKTWKRNFTLPLPASMRPYEWSMEEVRDG